MIRDVFDDRRHRVFVDVGANHHRRGSTSWYLETALGWSGIAVEPLTQFAAGYAAERPRTRFRAFFVSNVSKTRTTLYQLEGDSLVSSDRPDFTEQWGAGADAVSVPTITLDDLLEVEHLRAIDFVSIDVELAEPKVLAGFDVRRCKPALVCIEAHLEVRQQILNYFAANGYQLVGKYLRADRHNLYLTPSSQGAHGECRRRTSRHGICPAKSRHVASAYIWRMRRSPVSLSAMTESDLTIAHRIP